MDMKTSKRIPPGTPKYHRLTSENRITLNSAVGWRESPFEAMKPGLCFGFYFSPNG